MSFLRKLLFSLVAVVLFFAAAEGGLRAVGFPPMDTSPQFEHQRVYWVQDPDQDRTPVSHRETRKTFFVSTDKNGLRAPIHEETKPEGVFRILTLGCSTTFGWGVDDEESYPARLESILRERGHDDIEVINGGQPGYTTFQGLWLWDRALERYDPDVVIVGYIVQDARMVRYSDISQALMQGEAAFLKENVLYKSQVYRSLMYLLGRVRTQAKEEAQRVPRVSDQDYADHLRTFKKKIEGIGAQPVLFGFPLERVGYTEYHRKILRAAGEIEGMPHFDPSAEIEALTRQDKTLYFPQDRGHANAEGCDTIAGMMADFLESKGLLP